MIKTEEVVTGLYAAWRLFLRDRRAVALFDDSYSGVVKSFFCAVVVLPVYVLLLFFEPGATGANAGVFRLVGANLIAYVLLWVAWPLLMAYVAPAIDRGKEYCRYVAAGNWAVGPQMLVQLIVLLLAISGFASKPVLELASLIALFIVLLYHLFILRVVLRVGLFVGIGLVFGNVILNRLILSLRSFLLSEPI